MRKSLLKTFAATTVVGVVMALSSVVTMAEIKVEDCVELGKNGSLTFDHNVASGTSGTERGITYSLNSNLSSSNNIRLKTDYGLTFSIYSPTTVTFNTKSSGGVVITPDTTEGGAVDGQEEAVTKTFSGGNPFSVQLVKGKYTVYGNSTSNSIITSIQFQAADGIVEAGGTDNNSKVSVFFKNGDYYLVSGISESYVNSDESEGKAVDQQLDGTSILTAKSDTVYTGASTTGGTAADITSAAVSADYIYVSKAKLNAENYTTFNSAVKKLADVETVFVDAE